jgi:phosphatidylglycerol:prolipoprotein diacylglycerol transferase
MEFQRESIQMSLESMRIYPILLAILVIALTAFGEWRARRANKPAEERMSPTGWALLIGAAAVIAGALYFILPDGQYDVEIRYYGIIIVTAMLVATLIAARLAQRAGKDPEHVYGALTWAIIPGIILARLWFVLFPPESVRETVVPETFTYTIQVDGPVTDIADLGLTFIGAGAGVSQVEADSAADEAGLRAGDTIERIRLPGSDTFISVANSTSITDQLAALTDGGAVAFEVERDVNKDSAWYLRNFFDTEEGAVAIWSGGLSIFGALIGGFAGAYLYITRNKLPLGEWLDIAAVVIPVGQAIGRWANFVNRELYGTPTPDFLRFLGLDIPATERPAPYGNIEYFSDRFHPLFLYESIWSVLAFFVLLYLWQNYRSRFKPGDLFLIYIAQYAFVRFLLEFIRIEVTTVDLLGGEVNLSQLVCVIAFVLSIGALLYRHRPGTQTTSQPASTTA